MAARSGHQTLSDERHICDIFVSNIPTEDFQRAYGRPADGQIRQLRPQALYELVRRNTREAFKEYFDQRGITVTKFEMFCDRQGNLTGHARMTVLNKAMGARILSKRRYVIKGRKICVAPFSQTIDRPSSRSVPAMRPCSNACVVKQLPTTFMFLVCSKLKNNVFKQQGRCPCMTEHVQSFITHKKELTFKSLDIYHSAIILHKKQRVVRDTEVRNVIQRVDNLRRLEISVNDRIRSHRLDSDFLIFLSNKHPQLKELEVNNVQMGGASFRKKLHHADLFPCLHSLALGNIKGLATRDLSVLLQKCGGQVNELSLTGVVADFQNMPISANLKALTTLKLESLELESASMNDLLFGCQTLKKITMTGVTFDGKANKISEKRSCSSVQSLEMSNVAIKSEDMKQIMSCLRELRTLSICHLKVPGGWTFDFQLIPPDNLTSLHLDLGKHNQNSVEWKGNWSKFPKLESFEFVVAVPCERGRVVRFVEECIRYCSVLKIVQIHENIEVRMSHRVREIYKRYKHCLIRAAVNRDKTYSELNLDLFLHFNDGKCDTIDLINY